MVRQLLKKTTTADHPRKRVPSWFASCAVSIFFLGGRSGRTKADGRIIGLMSYRHVRTSSREGESLAPSADDHHGTMATAVSRILFSTTTSSSRRQLSTSVFRSQQLRKLRCGPKNSTREAVSSPSLFVVRRHFASYPPHEVVGLPSLSPVSPTK